MQSADVFAVAAATAVAVLLYCHLSVGVRELARFTGWETEE